MFSYVLLTDSAIPTISTNIENTDHGHCAKTLVILQKVWQEIVANKQLKQIKYVVLSDDDTLFRYMLLPIIYSGNFHPNHRYDNYV